MSSKRQPIVSMNVLPGEPVDGSGRVCIHLFVRDDHGSFTEPHVLKPATDESGNIVAGKCTAGPARGRLACDPNRMVDVAARGNVITVTPRSDDPRAVNCLKCKASVDYKRMMGLFESTTTVE